jgi:hypothetical protein
MSTTQRAARTAAEVAELFPELTRDTPVIVYTSWSRDRVERVENGRGTVVGAVRNGYVRVRCPKGTTCDYDPRDVVVL